MSDSQSSSRIKRLEESIATAELHKIELEIQILKDQLSPQSRRLAAIKTISGASGVLLVIVSIFGGGFSLWKWLEEQRLSRENQIEERLDSTLASLSSERAPERVAAIGSLRSFISANDERNRRVLVLASSALSVEQDRQVSNNILSFFRDIDVSLVDQDALNGALAVQVHFNRDQTRDLGIHARLGRARSIDNQVVDGGAQLHASSLAISILVEKGAYAQDMTGVSLVGVDMHGSRIPGVKFDNAILAWTDFSDSQLEGASILDANLRGTSFVHADLQGAEIGFNQEDYETQEREYVLQQLRMEDPRAIQMPMFGCADLRSAQLRNMVIFGSTEKFIDGRKISNYSAVDFYKADLSLTNFDNPIAFSLCEHGESEEQSNRCIEEFHGSTSGRYWNDPRGSLSFHRYESAMPNETKDGPAQENESSPGPLVRTLVRAFEGGLIDGTILPEHWIDVLIEAASTDPDDDDRCEKDRVHPFAWVSAEVSISDGSSISADVVSEGGGGEN